MKNIEDLFADYLDGKISEQELEIFFKESPSGKLEFEELKQLFQDLPDVKVPEVSEQADNQFYTHLSTQKAGDKKANFKVWSRDIFKYAAMFLAVGGAYYFGTLKKETITVEKPIYITQTVTDTIKVKEEVTNESLAKNNLPQPQVLKEIDNIKKEMVQINEVQHKMIMAMLRQESASSRLQAINYSYDLDVADKSLLNALVETLESDPSVNVRLAALEAVGRFELTSNMKESMVLTLAEQRDPSMQMALIKKLVELREVKALPILAGMVNNPTVSEQIRNQAEFGIKILNVL